MDPDSTRPQGEGEYLIVTVMRGLGLVLVLAGMVGAAGLPAGTSLPRWQLDAAEQAQPAQRRPLTIRELTDLAFGAGASARIRRSDRPPWTVLSDSPGYDDRALLSRLDRTYQQVRQDFPFLGDARLPAALLVFPTRAAARGFLTRLATHLGGPIDVPADFAGLSLLGIGIVWTDEFTAAQLERISVHEATHALTQQLFDIEHVPSWFAEGVAERAELLVDGVNVTPRIRALLASGQIPPLATLLDSRRIPGHGYLPAALLIDWLLADPLRRSQLPQFFRDAQAQPSPNLLPLLQRRMGISVDDLERGWGRWLAEKFGPAR